MPEKVIHEIRLNQYSAVPADRTRRFSLGTKDSYGIEQLRIVPGEGWDGLTITATFHPPEGEAVQVIVPADGLIDVPPEATRSGSELPIRYGKIVFAGVADGVQRISCNLPYTVMDHAPVDGAASSGPSPSWYEQATAHFLPDGGKAGQVLAKASDADLDVEWADGGNGTADHAKLSNRDAADQHPISAITGLQKELDGKQPAGNYLSADTLQAATDAALAQAKASGEFDGADGQPGENGADGAPGKDGAPGADGKDGITPTIGENGNWYLGSTDTGKPSRGEAGAQGPSGADGKSAYAYAVEGGYTGTEAEFAAKLAEEMPTALPNPNALTFTGAVTVSYDGSAPMSVEIPSGGGSGISTTAKNLLITILRSGVYTADQSDNITALETALGGGTTEPEEPDVPVEKTYSISNELINCTSSNSATSAKENAVYTATLTANDGYTLTGGTVTVTMGGVNITDTAYADGVISIASVTGDVEIFASAVVVQAEAALPEDGLISYFDFRTTTYDNAGSGGKTTIAPTKGSGQLFAWANNSISAQNEYGVQPATARVWAYDQNGGTTATALGDAFTVIQLTYGEVPAFGFNYTNIRPNWTFNPKYINTSGSTTNAAAVNGGNFNSDSKWDYNFTVFRADGATLTEIFDTSRTTYNGGDIDGFSRWLDTPYGNIANTGDTKYCTAMAIYNRALTDSEIEAAREFMNTLEVTA